MFISHKWIQAPKRQYNVTITKTLGEKEPQMEKVPNVALLTKQGWVIAGPKSKAD